MDMLVEALEAENGKLLYYCIMPYHYHLIILVRDYETLAKIMQRVSLSLSLYIRHREHVEGSVWKGRLWTRGIATDRDLLDTMKYIYDNPEKANIDLPENYRKGSAYECASYYRTDCYTDRPFLLQFVGMTLMDLRQLMRMPRSAFEMEVEKMFEHMDMNLMYRKYLINPVTQSMRIRYEAEA
jgi:REP element-mobilizing transposase RayT